MEQHMRVLEEIKRAKGDSMVFLFLASWLQPETGPPPAPYFPATVEGMASLRLLPAEYFVTTSGNVT